MKRFASQLLGLASVALIGSGVTDARAATALRLTFDRPMDASFAPFVLALSNGLYRDEDLNVTTDVAKTTRDAIARVASGDSDLALADINALARYRDEDGAAPIKAVFMLFNTAPYALIARKSRGVAKLSDLEGKTAGAINNDLSIRFWPAVAKLNGLNPEKLKIEKIGIAVREPMLSAGQIDAIAGFTYIAPINMRDRGIPANDLVVLRLSDHGSLAYGQAIIVNPKIASARPDAVRGFVRATIAGLRLAARNADAAVDAVMPQIDNGIRELEAERLRTVLRDNMLTDEVKRNGIGGIDAARFARALVQAGEDFKFRTPLSADDLFDASFLPPPGERATN